MTELPTVVTKFFWGDDLNQLSWLHHQKYICETILEKGDLPAITWLFKQVSKKQLQKNLPSYKLSQKSSNYWQLYCS